MCCLVKLKSILIGHFQEYGQGRLSVSYTRLGNVHIVTCTSLLTLSPAPHTSPEGLYGLVCIPSLTKPMESCTVYIVDGVLNLWSLVLCTLWMVY